MSVVLYTSRAIRCDHPGCDEEFEGFAGQVARSVRSDASAAGWCRVADGDRCPVHAPTQGGEQ